MRRFLWALSAGALLLASFAAVLGKGCKEEVLQPQVARITEEVLQELVRGNNAFALDLYQELRGEEGNLFFSPYSVSLALAMAYAGARGETAAEMAQALHFTLPQELLHPAFNALDLAIAEHAAAGGIELHTANGFWGQLGHHFLQEYVDLLSRNYGAEIRLADFHDTPDPCRARINDWVSEKTQGKIGELLPPGSITPLTRLVLTNAIYFKGRWLYQFDPQSSFPGEFHLLPGAPQTTSTAIMMHQRNPFLYAAGELGGIRYQAVELPYAGRELSMLLILPELVGYREFEGAVDVEGLGEILDGLFPCIVHLTVPKFSFDSGFSLRGVLSELGMPRAFSPEADFSGMDGTGELSLDEGYHRAFVKVDERGTEAFAVTAISPWLKASPPPQVEFKADHPFMFLIRDRRTGAILFLGRVLNPAG